MMFFTIGTGSFPLWERGLKSADKIVYVMMHEVVPLVGTWIEIVSVRLELNFNGGRSPCGNVD